MLILVADTSTNNAQEEWGLGGVVATIEGRVLATVRSRVTSKWASTTLLEATGIVELKAATRRELERTGRAGVYSLWPWCDNKAAATSLNNRSVLAPPYVFYTSVLATAELEFEHNNFSVGWGPAQHDTGSKSVLAKVNKKADQEARLALESKDTQKWVVPESWLDGPTVVLSVGGAVIANVKKAVHDTFRWQGEGGGEGSKSKGSSFGSG